MTASKKADVKRPGPSLLHPQNLRLDILLAVAFLLLSMLLFIPGSPMAASQYDNTSVESRVNVTNVAPTVRQVLLYDETNGPGSNIILTEGTTTHVICNATIRDRNGFADMNASTLNATAWITSVTSYDAADDNNNHYTNLSCTFSQVNITVGQATCSFQFEYYADNHTLWVCNVSILDTEKAQAFNISEDTTVEPLFAINVTTHNASYSIDFGNMGPADTTTDAAEQLVNITNTGNLDIGLAIGGYGSEADDGLAMNCTVGNISADNLRYNISNDGTYADMWNITVYSPPNQIPGLTIFQRVDDDPDPGYWNSTNTTWWKLYVPLGVKGFCNGTVTFTAMEQ